MRVRERPEPAEVAQQTTFTPTQPRAPRSLGRARLVALLVLMAISAAAHLAALERNLPIPDGDEEFFVEPAADLAATGDLSPGYYGHPGSTVIYPTAVLIHVWDVVVHDGPVFGSNADLTDRFAESPRPFYLLGRLWLIALTVATIPVLFALGRRVFGVRVAMIATALWTVIPYSIHFGRVVRTDAPAAFFATVTLYLAVRAWQEPRMRWWILTGLGLGLAVSSRYFMITLLPIALVAAAHPLRRHRGAALRSVATVAASSAVGFLITSPFTVLELSTTLDDITDQANVVQDASDGLSRPGNVWWYLSDGIPNALTWPLYLTALGGIVLAVRRRRPQPLLLIGFSMLFLVAISASALHWQRWAIPIYPVLALFAAVAVVTVARLIASWTRSSSKMVLPVAVLVTAALAVWPVLEIVEMNRYDRRASTERQAHDWLRANLSDGDRVLQSFNAFNLRAGTEVPVGRGIDIQYGITGSRTLDSYRSDGIRYVVIQASEPFAYLTQERQSAELSKFFGTLACETRLVAHFGRSDERSGAGVSIYRLDQEPVELVDIFCNQRAPAGA